MNLVQFNVIPDGDDPKLPEKVFINADHVIAVTSAPDDRTNIFTSLNPPVGYLVDASIDYVVGKLA